MMYSFNFVEDVLGILVVFIAFIYCTYNWCSSDNARKRMLPCEKALTKSRESNVNEQFKTLATCSFVLLAFTVVLVQWLHAKLNTAPNFIDAQVFMLKIMISATISRMSMCAKSAVVRLSSVRESDVICNKCSYCPKFITEEKENNAESTETIPRVQAK